MTKILELFGFDTSVSRDWNQIVNEQVCRYLGKRCYKVRKSDPDTSIGTCTVLYGKPLAPVVICPTRLTERNKIFVDCLHLLTSHEPGNDLHIVPEVSIPGGSVDFFLVSARENKVKDFVGIEIQTLDTTGTLWPERERLMHSLGIAPAPDEEDARSYGMNWKMTAKTILVQMHHKAATFEHVNKKLVLITQDKLLSYMSNQFDFKHMHNPAMLGDSVHFHAYSVNTGDEIKIQLASRLSTDVEGIAKCLALQAEARVELEQIIRTLEGKISARTILSPV